MYMLPKAVFHVLTLAVLMTSLAVLSSSAAADTVRVFLVGGQSNAEGIASKYDLPNDLISPQTDVDLYYYHRVSTSTLPMNQVIDLQPAATWPTCFGPEITFGRDMADFYADDDLDSSVAIIKYALGGTGLVDDPDVISSWDPPNGTCYTEFNSTVSSGLTALQAAHPGDDIEVTGMIWMQGEEELRRGDEVIALYPAALTDFIGDMRTLYGADMPFVIGQLSDNQTHYDVEDLQNFQAGQASVAAVDSNVGLVVTDGDNFTVKSDEIHFDTQGQMSLGYGFATEMQRLLTTDVPEPSTVALILTSLLALGFHYKLKK